MATSLEKQKMDEQAAEAMADTLLGIFLWLSEMNKRPQLIHAIYRFLQENSEDA